MGKRKFAEDDEDPQDQDHQDGQESDGDYVQSSRESDNGRAAPRQLRVTLSRTRRTASGPRSRDNEEDQGESDDGAADTPSGDNTSAAPDQNAAQNSEKSKSSRVRLVGKTEKCGKVTPWITTPKKANRSGGTFFCPICESGFTRAEGVNYHFPGCAHKYGNPQGYHWNSHESCAMKKIGTRRGATDPSPPIEPPAKIPQTERITRSVTSGKVRKPTEVESKLPSDTGGPKLDEAKRAKKEHPSEPEKSQKSQRSQRSQRQRPRGKEATEIAKLSSSGKFRIAVRGPPLEELHQVFHDMVVNGYNRLPLKEAMDSLGHKQIHIATMCSGTESPLLALGMIQEALRLSGKPALNTKHLFSAEIVSYKQAYIERNFHPDKLFRDIREIAAGGQATTAYGTLTDVPADVDILVAGFSCVDFSKLNKKAKEITDVGESSDTFRAILQYAKRYRPAVIILENVDGAPWDLIEAVWRNDRTSIRNLLAKEKKKEANTTAHGFDTFWDEDDLAYAAIWHRVDAKNYYIPQTRTRRYMICLDRRKFASLESADEAVKNWKQYMIALEHTASSPVEAFLLPEDDPRLQYAKDEMSKTGFRRDTDWEVCNGRHEDYRAREELGTLRPILNWTNDGCAKASSYLWTDWTLSQVERIWDTVEISYLRNAAKSIDSFYKARFWELSQNIDRFLDTTPEGVIGCLTPKGQQFSTIRGRPITGLEAIALQGLPIDTLLLTRESQKELIDLGGNAMTSTVVGAALLSALAVSHTILTRPVESMSQPPSNSNPAPTGMRFSELSEKQALEFDGSRDLSLEQLADMAKASVRLCHCESQSLTASALLRKCKRCDHHCCEKCGNMPKHDYEPLRGNTAPLRTEPQVFRKQMERSLPTRLQIDGLSYERLEAFAQFIPDRSSQDWTIFTRAILLAFNQEFRYESIKRSHCWMITYKAADSQLKLVFDQGNVHWLLYGQASESEPGNSRVRELLREPLARLTVLGRSMQRQPVRPRDILTGSWEIRLPISHTFSISITPQGILTDSWEKKLGLQGSKFIEKQVYTSLHVGDISDLSAKSILDHEICGDYDLLENCGTACSSLHRKRPTADGRDTPSFYLFLDADRNGPPDQDSFVFSTEKHRLEYGETRYVAATIDNNWRPPYKNSNPKADIPVSPEVHCNISGRWKSCFLTLRPYQGAEGSSLRFPKEDMTMAVFGEHQTSSRASVEDVYGCMYEDAMTALLACEIPAQLVDSTGWQVGKWTVIDQRSERQVAAKFAWLFARVKDLGGFHRDWRSLAWHPEDYQRCQVCAPEPPKIMWTCSRGGKHDKIIPYEDGREAGNFERKIKARPAPFLVQTRIDDDGKHTGRLLVGLNLPNLVHRALARLNDVARNDEIEIKWRLDTRWEAPTRYRLEDFSLTNNKLTREADYAFPTTESLRPEQQKSLYWMIGQEADDMAFYEEEIEEAMLSQLGWRAEVRVRRTRIVRGGILADEVGYGKTATTLALIDTQKEKAELYGNRQKAGCISIKATLILVPPHLIHQWQGQASKFLGMDMEDERILVIDGMTQLGKISIKRIKKAVIVLASWQVLSSTTYMTRMSHFAALPMGPSSGAREIEAWLTRACENIAKHTGELASESKSPKDFAEVLKQKLKAAHSDDTILRDIPTQRLKGAKYSSWNPADNVTPVDTSPEEEDLKRFFKHMTSPKCTELDSMTGLLLHMFDFYRIVVDEYTYVDDNQQVDKLSSFITTISARSRWVLSGTPSIQDFGDVQNLARFLACNLGTVDDAAGVVKGATIKHIRDHRTAAEQFRAFGFSHTAAWHISRQAHAQNFLDKYASKNIPHIGLINCISHLRPHLLGAAEAVPYAELQQQLQSTDMQIVLQGKSRRDNDRFRRYQDLLKGCKTASECLIKACSNFERENTRSAENDPLEDATDVDDQDEVQSDEDTYSAETEPSEDPMDVDDQDEVRSDEDIHSAENEPWEDPMDVDGNEVKSDEEKGKSSKAATLMSGSCESLINVREKELRALISDLEHKLLLAAWLEQQCRRATNKEHQGPHFLRWKSEMMNTGLKDPLATSTIRYFLKAAFQNVNADTEEIFYRDPPTAKELKKEKKADEERKKREKAKRAADRKLKEGKSGPKKRKASKKPTAVASPDEDYAEPDVSDAESTQADDMYRYPSGPKPEKIAKDDFEKYSKELRALTAHLRGLAAELVSRLRSRRFASGAHHLQQWHANRTKSPKCENCRESIANPDDISINIRCGHLTCRECIQKSAVVVCAVDGCEEGSESFRLRKAKDLVGDGTTWDYGSRLGNIIALINSLSIDEQVLMFVQFEDVMLNMAQALEEAGISNHALLKSAGRKMVEMMNDFQDNDGKDKKRVLLLNPSSETASGINLTNANHIIFASPLLTNTQQSYESSMTQCIGRAKRYGQRKTVHIYRFVALRTIDVDILQEREQKTLVKASVKIEEIKKSGMIVMGGPGRKLLEKTWRLEKKWELVSQEAIDGTMEAGWGSGYDFKSNSTEENDESSGA